MKKKRTKKNWVNPKIKGVDLRAKDGLVVATCDKTPRECGARFSFS